MHGGAVTLARRYLHSRLAQGARAPHLILATDMLDLTTFLALIRKSSPDPPAVLYMHENQLTYPLPRDPNTGPMRRQRGERDLHYVFINYASMLAADRVLFNSHYHRNSLLQALPHYLGRFPEDKELGSIRSLREKSSVLPVGLDLERLRESHPPHDPPSTPQKAAPDAPLVLWNQRWEYDKNPALFFRVLYKMQEEGVPFRLALCGERFSRSPGEFEEARTRLAHHIVHEGYAATDLYHRLLWSADITISTALHEFFGISVLEAIYCHTFPILPSRLSYPELLPDDFHPLCLYEDESALLERVRWALQHPHQVAEHARRLAPTVKRYSWQQVARRYDEFFQEVFARPSSAQP